MLQDPRAEGLHGLSPLPPTSSLPLSFSFPDLEPTAPHTPAGISRERSGGAVRSWVWEPVAPGFLRLVTRTLSCATGLAIAGSPASALGSDRKLGFLKPCLLDTPAVLLHPALSSLCVWRCPPGKGGTPGAPAHLPAVRVHQTAKLPSSAARQGF